jgi:hypothetical protein
MIIDTLITETIMKNLYVLITDTLITDIIMKKLYLLNL